jgi:hypothetical protein
MMKVSASGKLVSLLIVCVLGGTASFAFSKEKGKAKATNHGPIDTKGKHGRQAGELPFGLQRHTEKHGDLPAGLQKKKDAGGQLTRGLEKADEKLKPTGKRTSVSRKARTVRAD